MLKSKLEALLFSSGRKMSVEELAKLTRSKEDDVKTALTELKMKYDEKDSSLMLLNEGNSWKLTVREQHLPLVRNIVTETELSRTILETLAVIAFKYPIKQSDLIKIRTNKAYDHLKELEEMGYITRQKHGRTNLIKLTQKFFEYFDLPEEKLKDKFDDFQSIAKAIETKEREIEETRKQQKAEAEEEKKIQEQVEKGEVDIDGENLETYESEKSKEENAPHVISEKEKLGKLEVVDEPSEEELEKDKERVEKIKEEAHEPEKKKEERKFEGLGIKVTKDMEKQIDEKVDNILHPGKRENSEEKETKKKEEPEETKKQDEDIPSAKKESNEKPKDLLEAEMEENKEKEEPKEDRNKNKDSPTSNQQHS